MAWHWWVRALRVRGTCRSDQEAWFFPALAELVLPTVAGSIQQGGVDGFVERLESENRVIIEFEPVKWITFDGRRVGAHASGFWKPGDPWVEPDDSMR